MIYAIGRLLVLHSTHSCHPRLVGHQGILVVSEPLEVLVARILVVDLVKAEIGWLELRVTDVLVTRVQKVVKVDVLVRVLLVFLVGHVPHRLNLDVILVLEVVVLVLLAAGKVRVLVMVLVVHGPVHIRLVLHPPHELRLRKLLVKLILLVRHLERMMLLQLLRKNKLLLMLLLLEGSGIVQKVLE